MRKTFCDHCGEEIKGREINELGTDDCFFDVPNREFVGCGFTLCEECWNERINAHIELDKLFLNMVEESPIITLGNPPKEEVCVVMKNNHTFADCGVTGIGMNCPRNARLV